MVKLEAQEVSMREKCYTKEFREETVKQITERGYLVRDISTKLGEF